MKRHNVRTNEKCAHFCCVDLSPRPKLALRNLTALDINVLHIKKPANVGRNGKLCISGNLCPECLLASADTWLLNCWKLVSKQIIFQIQNSEQWKSLHETHSMCLLESSYVKLLPFNWLFSQYTSTSNFNNSNLFCHSLFCYCVFKAQKKTVNVKKLYFLVKYWF